MSQASKFLKIQSLEAGSFTPSKNIVTFELPTNATYDLNQSYIILEVQPNIVPIEIDTLNGVPFKGFLPYFLTHDGLFTNAGPEASMTGINGVLVRNSRFYSDRLGRLEDIRNSNQIMNYMSYFKHSIDEQTGTGYYSILSPPSDVNIFDRYNSTLQKQGGTFTDLNQRFQWQVPLKEFLNLGTMQSFNTTNMGNVRIQVELDLAKIGATTYCNANNDALHFGSASNLQINDIDDVSGTITTIVTSNKLGLDLAKSPYFVGQVIRVLATPTTAGGGVAEPAAIDESAIIITNIAVITDVSDANLGCLELTLSRSIGSLIAGQSYTAVNVAGSTEPGGYFGNRFFDLQSAELRLKQIPMVPMNELTYITITNESDNGLGLPVFNKQYFLEPECIGFILICSGDVPFVGGNGTVVSFRLAVDNVDVVGNRDVIDDLNNGLQYDLLNKLFLNLGIPLKNTMQRALRMDEIFTDNTQLIGGNGALTFVGSPTAQTPTMKILNVSLTGSVAQGAPGIQAIQLYKFLVKNVKL